MISLIKILKEDKTSNSDKFTAPKVKNNLVVNYNPIKLVKQSTMKDGWSKYNLMINGRYGGVLYINKAKSQYIASGSEANTTFQPKRFKALIDAVEYIKSNYTFSIPITVGGGSEEGSYQSYGY